MNKVLLVLVFMAFSGANVLATGLPRVDVAKPGVDLSKCGDGSRLELTSPNFADPPPEPPTRGGSDPGFKEISG